MSERPRLREAARVIVVDEGDRVLLVRFDLPGEPPVWATVGGGLESGESPEQAARRELREEAGLDGVELGRPVWVRRHLFERPARWDGQSEVYFLVRTPSFEPRPGHTWQQLNAEGVTAIRWWALDELEAADVLFAPRRLPKLVRALLRDGPPVAPLEIGS